MTLFARLLDTLIVELSDGSTWEMQKGDCFPVVAYKESHTKLILQLAGTSFVVLANSTAVVDEKDLPAALASYRINVNNYIDGFSFRWRKNAESGKP